MFSTNASLTYCPQLQSYCRHVTVLKVKSNFTAYIYTKKLLAIFLLKSWEFL